MVDGTSEKISYLGIPGKMNDVIVIPSAFALVEFSPARDFRAGKHKKIANNNSNMDEALALDEERAARSVVAKEIPPGVTESDLMIHFQRQKNGGGEVESVTIGKQSALITFEKPEGTFSSFLTWFSFINSREKHIYKCIGRLQKTRHVWRPFHFHTEFSRDANSHRLSVSACHQIDIYLSMSQA